VTKRLVQPVNQNAANAADDELYSHHERDPRPNELYDEEGNRQQLDPNNSNQTVLRREWMTLYERNGGVIEESPRSQREPGDTTEPCPYRFELQIVDDDCNLIHVKEPLPYRVYEENGEIIQEGILEENGAIRIEGDPSLRYSLWIDGEFVTFHDEPSE